MHVLFPPAPHLQNRPSVITCAPASNRNCNLSLCHMNGCSPSPPADQRKTNGESDERHHSTLSQSINHDLQSHFICLSVTNMVFWVTNAVLPSCSAVQLHLRWILCIDKTKGPSIGKAELGHLSLTSNAPCTSASCTYLSGHLRGIWGNCNLNTCCHIKA